LASGSDSSGPPAERFGNCSALRLYGQRKEWGHSTHTPRRSHRGRSRWPGLQVTRDRGHCLALHLAPAADRHSRYRCRCIPEGNSSDHN
jgi:hypothetical protein